MFIKHYLCIIKLANKLNMEKETAKILPIQPTLKAMEIGEMVAFKFCCTINFVLFKNNVQ